MNNIKVYQNKVFTKGEVNSFQVGVINEDVNSTDVINLINITNDVDIELIAGEFIILSKDDNNIIFVSSSNNFRLILRYNNLSLIVNFLQIEAITAPTDNDILNQLRRLQPDGIYSSYIHSNTYTDDLATAKTIDSYYQNINNLLNNIYPNAILTTQWLEAYFDLYNNKNIITEILSLNTKNEFIKFLYRLNYFNKDNPYNLAFTISKYIYLRTGIIAPVFVAQEGLQVATYPQFILDNNSLSNVAIGITNIPASVPRVINIAIYNISNNIQIQNELNIFFVRKILNINQNFILLFPDNGLIAAGFTFATDPAILKTREYIISYNPAANHREFLSGAVKYLINPLENLDRFDVLINGIITTGAITVPVTGVTTLTIVAYDTSNNILTDASLLMVVYLSRDNVSVNNTDDSILLSETITMNNSTITITTNNFSNTSNYTIYVGLREKHQIFTIGV